MKPLLIINHGFLGLEFFFPMQTTLQYKPQEVLFRYYLEKERDRHCVYPIFCCDFDEKWNHEILTPLQYEPLYNINCSENWCKKYTIPHNGARTVDKVFGPIMTGASPG